MGFLESLLRNLDLQFVNAFILSIMTFVCLFGFLFTKKDTQKDFVNYVPTLLTTLGIFGTFLGIVLGLLNFNQNNIEASIPLLLAGLKTAFITSLFGIFTSILFKTLSSFSFLRPKQQDSNEVSEVSAEAIFSTMRQQVQETKLLREALVGNEESTLFGQLKILRSDINDHAKLSLVTIKEQATNQSRDFEKFSEKLWLKLQDFADTLSKSATEQVIEALKKVIEDFNNNLTDQFGENFKELNNAVHKLVEWQANYKLQLEDMNKQYAQGIASLSMTEQSVANISEQSKVIPETMTDLKKIMEVNQHQLSELESHLNAFKDMRDKAVEAVPEIRKQVEATVNDISSAVISANEHYKNLLTESDKYIQTHVKTSEALIEKFAIETEKGINSIGSTLKISSESISEEIELASREFNNKVERINGSLQGTSDHLQSGSENVKQTLNDAVTDVNNHMRDMIEKLSQDAKDITSTMKTVNQNLASDTKNIRDLVVKSTEKLQQRLSDMLDETANQQIMHARKVFETLKLEVEKSIGLTDKAVENQVQLIDTSMQTEIERVMNTMGQALAKVTGRFVQDYTQMLSSMNFRQNKSKNIDHENIPF